MCLCAIMPFIDLETNLPASKFSEDFLKRLCTTTALALGKPEDRMNLVVKADLPMLIACSCSPCVMLSVSAIGVTDTADKNKEHSAKIFQFLTRELEISEDRIVIRFHSLEPWQLLIPKAMEVEVPKDKMDSAIENLDRTLKQFEEKFLQDRPFIVGDQISLADLVAVVEIIQPLGAGLDVFENRPKLRAWKDRVREAIGAELFDEAHQTILSCQEIVETMGPNKFGELKPLIVKYFLS